MAPDGTRWHVRRVWWRGRPRWRRRLEDLGDGGLPDLGGDDLVGLAAAVVLAIVLVLVVPFLLPAVVFVVEVVLVVVLGGFALLGRLLLRRPWAVRAVSADGRVIDRQAVGWRGSAQAVADVADAIRAGRLT